MEHRSFASIFIRTETWVLLQSSESSGGHNLFFLGISFTLSQKVCLKKSQKLDSRKRFILGNYFFAKKNRNNAFVRFRLRFGEFFIIGKQKAKEGNLQKATKIS